MEACRVLGPSMHSLVHPPQQSNLDAKTHDGEEKNDNKNNSDEDDGDDEYELELHISLSRELYLRNDRWEGLAREVRDIVQEFQR